MSRPGRSRANQLIVDGDVKADDAVVRQVDVRDAESTGYGRSQRCIEEGTGALRAFNCFAPLAMNPACDAGQRPGRESSTQLTDEEPLAAENGWSR